MKKELVELPLEVPNLSIAYLLEELKPLVVGAFVERAQDLEKNWFKLRLRSKNGTQHLVFSPKGFFVSNYRVDARQQSSGFGAFLRKRIQGKKVLSLEQLGSERIVRLGFDGFALVAELFGKGNLLLLDSNGKILKPYKRESWRSRTLAVGEEYRLPPKRGLSPVELKLEDFREILKECEEGAVRAVIAGVNIPPVLAEEVFTRASVSMGASALSQEQVKALYLEISRLYSMPALKGERACLVVHSNKRVLLPFKPKNKLEVLAQYDSLNDALNELLLIPFLKPAGNENKKKRELERTLREQQQALEASERAEKENRKKAELIYAHYPAIMRAVNEIRTLQGKDKKKEHIMYKRLSGVVSVKALDLKKKSVVFVIRDPE